MPGRRGSDRGHRRPRRRRGMRLILRPALLLLLAEGDSHGYDLMEQLSSFGFDSENWDSSMLYRDLRDMEECGLIESSWDDDSKGPRRRVYQINDQGLRRLGAWLESLDQVRSQIGVLQERFNDLPNNKE